ncbi:imidazolonepropionase [bacterium]|nr:imidazolonepropionase [candidate division CSSED10-310 bacterium]
MKPCADLIVTNISSLLTLSGPERPRSGVEMSNLGIIPNAAMAISGDTVIWTGPVQKLAGAVDRHSATLTIDAENHAVLPGFVECHTHLVFGGTREDEFARKIAGVPYMQIAAEGGGIKRTVRDTRAASEADLMETGLQRIREALRLGITAIEIKSGYGLNMETERKILTVARQLAEQTPATLVTTFLGAHEIPVDRSREEYLDEVCEKMIPFVAREKLAEFCDVFCEKGVFSLDESERVLTTGIHYGLKPKIHADQLTPGGGAELASRMHAVSADHLDYTGPAGMKALADAGVVGVLLPGAVFFLGLNRFPAARDMIAANVPIALSTDFNPGSCMSLNIHLMMTIACTRCRMTIPETLTAVTHNAACAIDRQNRLGSLVPGKQADFVILDCPSVETIPYHFGHNHVKHVFCKGRSIVENGIVLPFQTP